MREQKVIWRWIWVWDFEKEEEWLNAMAMDGWVLDRVQFCRYTFVRCEPGEYAVRLEARGMDDDYLSFMAGTGAEYIGRVAQWIYFRKKTADGAFDLFSDIDSRIGNLERLSKVLTIVGAVNILIGVVNSTQNNLGYINLLCGCLLMYALGRIHGKAEALKKERRLHE